MATALGQATRWTEVSLLTGDTMDNVVLVEAPGVALMLQPRLLGTWFVFAQDPAISSAEATLRVIRQHVEQNPGGSAYLVFKTLDAEQHLLVRRDGETWTTGMPDFATDEVAETEAAGRCGPAARHRGVPWRRRSRDVPQEPGYVPPQPPEAPMMHRRPRTARSSAYTDEEYGVRKDDGLGSSNPSTPPAACCSSPSLPRPVRRRSRSTESFRSP